MVKSQVLVVDDDRDIAEWFQSVLVLMDFEVEIAHSARQALQWLASNVPDLIVLDMRLGVELGGEDILYQVRSNARFNQPRVIVVTGYPSTAEIITNLADLVMMKPVSLEQFQSLVRRVFTSQSDPKQLAFRDPVTMLFNKDFFMTRLELAFDRANRRSEFYFAVVLLQMQVLEPGDGELPDDRAAWVLAEISRRLTRNLRPMDTIARVASWKFSTLQEELHKESDVETIVLRLKRALEQPFQLGVENYQFEAGFGIAIDARRFAKPADMFEQAGLALQEVLAA